MCFIDKRVSLDVSACELRGYAWRCLTRGREIDTTIHGQLVEHPMTVDGAIKAENQDIMNYSKPVKLTMFVVLTSYIRRAHRNLLVNLQNDPWVSP